MYKYIDVSTFQGTIDWERVKKTDVAGVMIRAGYGQGNIDAQFGRNISECNRLGIPCGIYWFSYAYSKAMALAEAHHALRVVEPYRLELPIAFDWEYDSRRVALNHGANVTPELVNAMVKTFCGTIEAGGYYAMNYSNGDFLKTLMTDVAAYDLWYAAWPNSVDVTKPPRPCGIWQWGGSTVDGISGAVDTNEAYKDYPTIIRAAGLNHLNDPPEPWYADTMRWAKANGICDGERPEEPATRAEVAQMIRNFATKKE